MPVVDDLTEAISKFGDALVYDLLKLVAEALWWMIKSLLLLAWQVNAIDTWLSDGLFPPLIQTAGAGSARAASMTFVLALALAGITYLIAMFVRLEVVNPRKAILWFLAATLFFQFAPQLYGAFHSMRTGLATAFFSAGLDGIQGASGNPFAAFSGVTDSDPLVPYDLCDNYGPYFASNPGNSGLHHTIRGADVALAFLRSNGHDLMGYSPPYSNPGGGYCGSAPFAQRSLPQWWLENPWALGGYFYEERDSNSFDDYGSDGRRDSIENAFLGLRRLVTSLPLVVMGVVDSLIVLLLTIAEGLVFLSAGIALVFAYFNRTEVIALSVIDQLIQLIVQTVIIALLQSMIMGLTVAAAASSHPFLLLGMGTLAAILMTILLWSGVKAVFSSMNRLFQAMGSVTGGSFITPAQAAVGMAGAGVGGALVLGGAGVAGAAIAGRSLRQSTPSDPANYASRALRGSGHLFQAGLYSMAVGTGNPRVAQLGQLSFMLHQSTRSLQPASALASGSAAPPPVTPSNLPATPILPTASPTIQQPRTTQLPRLRSALEEVGEEIEETLRQPRPATMPITYPPSLLKNTAQPGSAIKPAEPPVQRLPRLVRQPPNGQTTTLPQPGPAPSQPVPAPDQRRAVQDQARHMGLTPQQLQIVIRAVRGSAGGQLSPHQQQVLTRYAARQLPLPQAQQQVQTLLQMIRQHPGQPPEPRAVTVQPRVQVMVQPPAGSTPQPTDPARQAAAAAALHGQPTFTPQERSS